jgi:hypothetical protein
VVWWELFDSPCGASRGSVIAERIFQNGYLDDLHHHRIADK